MDSLACCGCALERCLMKPQSVASDLDIVFSVYHATHPYPLGNIVQHDPLYKSLRPQVVWVGEHRVLTTGFGADRCRQLILRDTRLVEPFYNLYFAIFLLQSHYFLSSPPPGSCRAHSTFSPLTSPPASSSPSSTPTPTWSSSQGKETGDNHDQTDGFLNDTFVIVPPLCIYILLYMDDIMVALPVKGGQIM